MAMIIVSNSTLGISGNGNSFSFPGGGSSISADGRYIVYHSFSSNLAVGITGFINVFLYDGLAGTTTLVTPGANSVSWRPSISADGRYVSFSSFASNLVEGDTNGWPDIL